MCYTFQSISQRHSSLIHGTHVRLADRYGRRKCSGPTKRYWRSKRKVGVILSLDVRLREIIIDRGPGAEFPNNAAFVFPRRRGPRINSNFHLSSSFSLAPPPPLCLYFFSLCCFKLFRNEHMYTYRGKKESCRLVVKLIENEMPFNHLMLFLQFLRANDLSSWSETKLCPTSF